MKKEEKDNKIRQMIISKFVANTPENRLEEVAKEVCELSAEDIEKVYLQFDSIYDYNLYLRNMIYTALDEGEYV